MKVINNADRILEKTAKELSWIADRLTAKPVIISERRDRIPIESGAVYERHGVAVISPQTFKSVVSRGLFPLVYVKQGGVFAKLNFETLKKLREAHSISMSELADKLGVSRSTVYEYERGTIDPGIETAIHLEELFGPSVVRTLSPFDAPTRSSGSNETPTEVTPQGDMEEQVAEKMSVIGVQVVFPRHAPFDAIAQAKGGSILTGIGHEDASEMKSRVYNLGSLARVLNRPSLVVVQQRTRSESTVLGVPVVDLEELDDFEDQRDLMRVVNPQTDQ